MLTELSIDDMIALESFWDRTPSGVSVEFRNNLHAPQYVSYEQLQERDPRLLLVLHEWYRKHNHPSSSTYRVMPSDLLRYTLSLWTGTSILLEKEDGIEFHVGALMDIVSLRGNLVKLDIRAYNVDTIEGVLYADSVYPAGVVMHQSVLDLHYPGWEPRLKVAHSLETSPNDTAPYVLQAAPVKCIAPPPLPNNLT